MRSAYAIPNISSILAVFRSNQKRLPAEIRELKFVICMRDGFPRNRRIISSRRSQKKREPLLYAYVTFEIGLSATSFI